MRAFFIDKYYKNSFLKLESIFVYPLSMGKIFIKEKDLFPLEKYGD
jgi:hypothetical protein